MPVFDYKCGKCHTTFEELVRANKEVKCPKCGALDVIKLISKFTHSFPNGDGFTNGYSSKR